MQHIHGISVPKLSYPIVRCLALRSGRLYVRPLDQHSAALRNHQLHGACVIQHPSYADHGLCETRNWMSSVLSLILPLNLTLFLFLLHVKRHRGTQRSLHKLAVLVESISAVQIVQVKNYTHRQIVSRISHMPAKLKRFV